MKSRIFDYIKNYRATLTYTGLCLGASVLLTMIARSYPAFSSRYAETVPPVFINTIGRLFSLFPFSVFEVFLLAACIFLLIFISRFLVLLIRRPRQSLKYGGRFLHGTVCFLSVLLLLFTLTTSINYSRPDISAGTDSTVREYSEEELLGLALLLIDDISALSAEIPTDEEGLLSLDHAQLGSVAAASMRNLGDRYPSLSGYYPVPKPVFFSKAMSYMGITGIFSPFTFEANFNNDVPAFIIPYTITHELAHLKGFMKEDEAGFLAYLACAGSDSPEFRYSGTLNALQYSMSQLYSNTNSDVYNDVYMSIPERVRAEVTRSTAYWESHTSSLTSMAKTANDKYLAVNAQTDGTKSYGRMVDLLLKEYEDRIFDKYGDRIILPLLDKSQEPQLN